MRLQFLSTLLIAFLATEVSAETLYRGTKEDKVKKVVPSDARLLGDFGGLQDGNFIYKPDHGLSTFNDPGLIVNNTFIYHTTDEDVETAGFIVTVDGEPGHRLIAIKEGDTIPKADLRGRLEAIKWEGPIVVPVDVVNNLESNDATQSADGENWINSPGPTRQYVQALV